MDDHVQTTTPGACPALRDVLLHGKQEIDRIAAAGALGEIGGGEAAACLVAYFGDTYSGRLNEAVAAALGKCGEPGLDALIDLVHDVKTRSLAEQVLRTLGDPRASRALADTAQQREGYLPVSGLDGLLAEHEAAARERLAAMGKSAHGLRRKRLIAWGVAVVGCAAIWALPIGRLGFIGPTITKYVLGLIEMVAVSRVVGWRLGIPFGWRW
jgi:HEAT repeat protein